MKPNNRTENYLAQIAGDPDAVSGVDPKTRDEYYLSEIAKNSPLVATFSHDSVKNEDNCDLEWDALSAVIAAGKTVVAVISTAKDVYVYLPLVTADIGATGKAVFQGDVWETANWSASTGPHSHTYYRCTLTYQDAATIETNAS